MLAITFQIEVEKYEAAIAWVKELAHNSIFDIERLKAITDRLLSDVPDAMRSGHKMLAAVQQMIHYTPDSTTRARTALVRRLYLKRIKQLLANDPEEVISRMHSIRKSLFQPDNFRLLVIADLEKLPRPASSWHTFIESFDTPCSDSLKPLVKPIQRLSEAAKEPGKLAYVVPMPTIDSSFANASAKGPDSYSHPRLPALMVAVAYMNATEGPLWVAVRGTGLAYGVNFVYDVDKGLVHYQIYRSPNAHKAFLAGKKSVEDHISGQAQIDPTIALESAISSIVKDFAFEQGTYYAAAQDSFVRQVIRELPGDYKKTLLEKIRAVGVEDLKASLRDIILPIFTPDRANLFVTCAPGLEEVCYGSFFRVNSC
jgi:Zn-dependent M16 (insulinase) family peptidase